MVALIGVPVLSTLVIRTDRLEMTRAAAVGDKRVVAAMVLARTIVAPAATRRHAIATANVCVQNKPYAGKPVRMKMCEQGNPEIIIAPNHGHINADPRRKVPLCDPILKIFHTRRSPDVKITLRLILGRGGMNNTDERHCRKCREGRKRRKGQRQGFITCFDAFQFLCASNN